MPKRSRLSLASRRRRPHSVQPLPARESTIEIASLRITQAVKPNHGGSRVPMCAKCPYSEAASGSRGDDTMDLATTLSTQWATRISSTFGKSHGGKALGGLRLLVPHGGIGWSIGNEVLVFALRWTILRKANPTTLWQLCCS